MLKGSFDKACALTCRFLCRSPPHPPPSPPPSPFPLLSRGKPPPTPPNPTPNPSPRDTNRNSHPFAKTTPGKNYPLVSAQTIAQSAANGGRQREPDIFFFMGTPSLSLVVDFGVWFSRWSFWWIFLAVLLWRKEQKIIHKIKPTKKKSTK